MTRWITAGAVTAAVVFGLACGGAGGNADNAPACKRYVEKQNSLACMSMAQLNANDMCPDTLDMSPIDMASYYDCLAENAKCNGDIPDLAGQANCTMPSM
jgi:hypothetical protein